MTRDHDTIPSSGLLQIILEGRGDYKRHEEKFQMSGSIVSTTFLQVIYVKFVRHVIISHYVMADFQEKVKTFLFNLLICCLGEDET